VTRRQDKSSAEEVSAPPDTGDLLRSYEATYERRARKSPERAAFTAEEPNALLGIYQVHEAEARKTTDLDKALETLTMATRVLLEPESAHSPATDMAGYAWARAFGLLPLHHPPSEQIERVLQSGLRAGAVTGLVAAGWRALFLSEALTSLSWEHRPTARAQLERWVTYLEPKATAFTSQGPASAPSFSLAARTAFMLATLGGALGLGTLEELARRGLSLITSHQRDDGSIPVAPGVDAAGSTAVIAQFAAAAYAAGLPAAGNDARGFLLAHRQDRSRKLLLAEDAGQQYELSPWVPLALLGNARAPRDPAQAAVPRRLRDVIFGGRRRY
jgi:hypothetical protein